MNCEARPFIDHFKLNKDFSNRQFNQFLDENISLIVSGIGKMKSAIATTFLLSQAKNLDSSIIFNIGIAGSAKHHSIGAAVLVNKITDHESGRSFFPAALQNHNLEEARLESFSQAVSRKNTTVDNLELVDMEASGYYEAASNFLSASQIYCIKVVSDHLDDQKISKQFVSDLILQNLDGHF